MLKIKLARFGKRKQPHYRIVINEARSKRDGMYVDVIGHYAPTQEPKLLEIDVKAYKAWVQKGAQPTDTVASLVARYESGKPFPAKKPQLSKKAKAKLEAAKEEKKAAAEAAKTEKTTEEKVEVEVSPAETSETPEKEVSAPTEEVVK